MKIYLASPFFNDNEIANIHRAAEILKAKSMEAIDESFFDYYMNNEISALEIKDSFKNL